MTGTTLSEPGRLEHDRRTSRRQLGLLWGAVSVLLLVLSPMAERLAEGVPRCLLKTLSDLPCPTCGSTRAALALARLDLLEALALNPLATLAWSFLVAGGLAAGALALAGRPVPEPTWRLGSGARAMIVLILLVNWAYLVHAGI